MERKQEGVRGGNQHISVRKDKRTRLTTHSRNQVKGKHENKAVNTLKG